MQSLPPDIAVLDRYIAGQSSSDEQLRVETWLASDSDAPSLLATLRNAGERISESHEYWYSDATWNRLQQAIRSEQRSQRNTRHNERFTRRMVGAFSAVGLALALVIVGITTRTISTRTPTLTAEHTYSTSQGQRVTVTLAQGVLATIGPATTLRVIEHGVELDGEALFTVTHHSDAPFVVRTNTTETRVLGTTFSVRHYLGDSTTRVAVAQGRVSVQSHRTNRRNATSPVVLGSGDLAMTDANGVTSVSHNAEQVLAALAFAQGSVVFDAMTLGAAADELSRWLNVDIRVDSSAAWRPFSVTLHRETLTQALDMIAALTQTKYSQRGRVITFTGQENR